MRPARRSNRRPNGKESDIVTDLSRLKPGLEGHAEIVVGEQHTAPKIGSGRVRVLATPVMINLMEAAALDAVENLIPEGNQSLGTHLDVRHIAATPVGMRVRATARLVAVDGRKLEFKVEAHDEKDLIGDGAHSRLVVNVARFDQRVQAKLAPRCRMDNEGTNAKKSFRSRSPWRSRVIATSAPAQDYPSKPITLMVGLAAGGITDVTARLYAEAVSKSIGQRVTIENKTGAGGGVAAAYVQNATPDGYTLLVFSGSQHATVPAVSNANYDPVKGFSPITYLFNASWC